MFAKIKPFTVRETKDSAGIELPQKNVENIPVALEDQNHASNYFALNSPIPATYILTKILQMI